jgi:Na+-transporting NADH:ubiquinone oxidoreductase subunit A
VSLQIEVDETLGIAGYELPATGEREALRGFMLESGAWSSLRTRPFGNIPDPDAEPAAIFVTALDAEPLAPDPRPIIDARLDEFNAALDALTKISAAPLYVCLTPGHTLGIEQSDGLRCISFTGGHQAGLPGIHINALCPIGFEGGEVWHLGYQDAISMGHLLLKGMPWAQRVISLGGSAVKSPRSLLVAPGAAIDQLLADELVDGPAQVFAGSSIYGRPLSNEQKFLSAGQRQITAQALSDNASEVDQLRGGVLIPNDRLEQLAPPGIFPVPLMRALQLGDAERARELGALELVEEDVAALSRACVSSNDYGLLLRRVLDQLEAAR